MCRWVTLQEDKLAELNPTSVTVPFAVVSTLITGIAAASVSALFSVAKSSSAGAFATPGGKDRAIVSPGSSMVTLCPTTRPTTASARRQKCDGTAVLIYAELCMHRKASGYNEATMDLLQGWLTSRASRQSPSERSQ